PAMKIFGLPESSTRHWMSDRWASPAIVSSRSRAACWLKMFAVLPGRSKVRVARPSSPTTRRNASPISARLVAAVEAVDRLRVFLQEDPPLDLLGRGQLAGFERELGGQDLERADLLEA